MAPISVAQNILFVSSEKIHDIDIHDFSRQASAKLNLYSNPGFYSFVQLNICHNFGSPIRITPIYNDIDVHLKHCTSF